MAGGAALTMLGVAVGAAIAGTRRRPAPTAPPVIAPERLVRRAPEKATIVGVAPAVEAPVVPTRPSGPDPDAIPPVVATRRRRGGALGALLIVALVAGSVAAAVWVGDDVTAPEAADSPALAAESWDPEVAELAAFVEDQRGLAFEAVVPVEFLPAAEYDDAAEAASGDGSMAALLRAFGLVEGDIELAAPRAGLVDDVPFGFYDRRRGRILVRGDEIDATTSATLVHELTHALQDQHFPGLLAGNASAGERFGSRALAEGDALRTSSTPSSTPSTDEQEAYEPR